MRGKSGELGDGELLGTGIGAQIEGFQRFADAIWLGERAQVVDQRLALFREAHFYKIQELRCGCGRIGGFENEFRALARKTEGDERGGDVGRRTESSAGNLEDDFRARVELREDGEIAVVARAWTGGEAFGNFLLNDDVDFIYERGEAEEVLENRRSDVVREVAIKANAAAGGESGEIGFEDVSANDIEMGKLLGETAQAWEQTGIHFDGMDGIAGSEKVFGHFAVPRTDFDPAVEVVLWKGNGGVGRDTDGACDFFAPVEIGEKVLAEPLASHGWTV